MSVRAPGVGLLEQVRCAGDARVQYGVCRPGEESDSQREGDQKPIVPQLGGPEIDRFRRAEEEESCRIVGVPKENIYWLGYEDGDLEYADPQTLRGQVARYIKMFKPDAVFSPDPGATWEQWHKTDHRMAAGITQDAFIAAEWHLYYPQHLLDEDLKPHPVPVAYYYYSQEPNYEIDITEQMDRKVQASAAHVSQFEPSTSKYTPEMPELTYKQIEAGFKERNRAGDRYVERFRRKVSP